jgi:RNA 3'-terminal phosphate cyclase (ATP)
MVEIDGSYGEGGGQVLRTSLALSAITGQSVRIDAIRARRRNPGLAPQHLATVQALARVCDAHVRGAAPRSTSLVFEPRSTPTPGDYEFDVSESVAGGSAGAVSLILQAVLLPLALAPSKRESRVVLRGGTHVPWSPSFHYLKHVFLPTAARMGVACSLVLDDWGFYPVGGGQITCVISARHQPLGPITLVDRGQLRHVWGLAVAANLPAHIPQRIAARAASALTKAGVRAQVKPLRERAAGPGAALVLVAEYEDALAGFAAIGVKGKPSEQVADEAVLDFLANNRSGYALDMHLADQLLLPAALAAGQSVFSTCRVTQHLLTNAHIIHQFIDAQIDIDGREDQPGHVTVNGHPPV